jgi:hypothetical protein
MQEQRVVLPILASANPVLTAPLPPLPIVPLLPPPPGLPALPDIDRPNLQLVLPVSLPTVPSAPQLRRTDRQHHVRTPSDFGYSAIAETDLLPSIDHIARANSSTLLCEYPIVTPPDNDSAPTPSVAPPLNVNPDGSPLTYRTATHGLDSANWQLAEDQEIDRLLQTKTMHPIHLSQQPLDRRADITYYNPKPKEKYDDDMNKTYRIRGTAGGDRINYDGPTKANTASVTT